MKRSTPRENYHHRRMGMGMKVTTSPRSISRNHRVVLRFFFLALSLQRAQLVVFKPSKESRFFFLMFIFFSGGGGAASVLREFR